MTTPKRWQEIDRIFAAALEREAGSRPAFLAEACGDDEQLRAEVESLLAHDVPESLVAGPAVEEATRLLANENMRGPDVTSIGPYQIVKLLGAGGMGKVYLAHDERLNRPVAVKLLSRYQAAEEERIRRFQQEAFAASALNHPNILTIYEIGVFDEQNFIATEFIEGVTLRSRLGRRELPVSLGIEIATQVASALSAAHEAGIVHRDIKPENVMIRADGLVKVLDFGIAKYVRPDGGAEQDQVETKQGSLIGTVPYMSPEQAGGLPVDARTDIWSLGVMLYEMVTGRVAFLGETPTETISLILQKEPAPLSRYAHDVPAELERIITKALTKDREERYQTAKDLLIDLRNLKRKREVDAEIERTAAPDLRSPESTSSGQSTPATASGAAAATAPNGRPSTSNAEYVVAGIKQHKLGMTLALVVLITAAVGLSLYLRARNTNVAIDSIAVLPFQNKSTEADTDYLSDGLAESLVYRLSQLPNLKVSPTSSVFRYKGREIDPVKVGQELGVNAVVSGRIVERGDNLTISVELVDVRNNKLLWGEQYDRKISDLLATQREIAQEIVEKMKLKVSGEEKALAKHYTENNEAYQLYLKGRFYWNKRTEEGMRRSIEYFQQAIEKDPNFALAYSGLADTYALLGAQDAIGAGISPNESLPKAKSAALKALEIDDTLAEPHVSLAHVKYLYDRDWAGAEREFKRAIQLNPNYPLAHYWYALYLMDAGRLDQAEAEARLAHDLEPLSLPINMILGWVLWHARQYDQSIDQLRKTLDMDPNFTAAHHRLGLAYQQKGMYDEAIAEFRRVFDLSGGKPLAIASLAQGYALAGKQEEARKNLAELLEMSKHQYVAPGLIALVYTAFGDEDQAFNWLDNAVEGHDAQAARLKVEPRFDSLRSDPRFAELVRKVGLPQ